MRNLLQKLPKLRKKLLPSKDSPKLAEESLEGSSLIGDYRPQKKQLNKEDLSLYYHSPYFIKGAQVFIIVISTLFLFLTYRNYSLDRKIRYRINELNQKVQQAETYTEDLSNLQEISGKIETLKEYKAGFKPLSPMVELFLNNREGLEFSSFKLEKTAAYISGESPSPLTFSLITNKYLKSGLISQIILKAASVNNKRGYDLTVEVIIK